MTSPNTCVNLLWKHGILAEKPPSIVSTSESVAGSSINVEEGRIRIIAWGWVDQYDELDGYLDKSSPLVTTSITTTRCRVRCERTVVVITSIVTVVVITSIVTTEEIAHHGDKRVKTTTEQTQKRSRKEDNRGR